MMKTKNTLENKSKFFSIYYSQKVLQVGGGVGLVKVGLDGWNLKHPSFYLELKPLESVSDEDAKFLYCSKKGVFKTERVSLINYEFNNNVFCIEIYSPDYDSSLIPVSWFSVNDLSIIHIDYLRSKGYALPYMDLSVQDLIDYGWIKLITK